MLKFVVIATTVLHFAGAAKILMLPFYHNSHVNMFFVAGKALQKAGHEVTILSPEYYASKIAKSPLKGLIVEINKTAEFTKVIDDHAVDIFLEKIRNIDLVGILHERMKQYSLDIMANKTLFDEMKKSQFDLVVIDGIPVTRFYYLIAYKLGIPYMTINAAYDPWGSGVTALPSVEPGQIIPVSPDMTFFERIQTLVTYLMMMNLPRLAFSHIPDSSEFVPEKETRSLSYLYAHSEMVLVNLETNCFDYPRVSAPHFRYIAGASAHAPDPLPADIERFIADANDGIVIVTFGSVRGLRLALPYFMDKMLQAFGRLKQKVLFAYSPEKMKEFNPPKNVLALDWLPQNDLLGNNKTKLFVTHAGNNGQLESLFHGVPMLAIPFDGDQIYNSKRSEYRGYGETIDMRDFTADEMYERMDRIINTPKYTENIKKCSRIIKSMPTPGETIVFWVNHILEFGGSHLRPISIDMPLYKILMLDIFLFFTVLIYVLVRVIFFLVKFVCRKVCCSGKKVKTE